MQNMVKFVVFVEHHIVFLNKTGIAVGTPFCTLNLNLRIHEKIGKYKKVKKGKRKFKYK